MPGQPSNARTRAIRPESSVESSAAPSRHSVDLVGVVLDEPMRRFDHPQRLAQRALGAVGVVDEHRKHLDVDTTVTQLRQPVLPEIGAPVVRWPSDHRHQQVVVRVGHHRRPVQLLSVNRRHRSPVLVDVLVPSIVPANHGAPDAVADDMSAGTNPRRTFVGTPR